MSGGARVRAAIGYGALVAGILAPACLAFAGVLTRSQVAGVALAATVAWFVAAWPPRAD